MTRVFELVSEIPIDDKLLDFHFPEFAMYPASIIIAFARGTIAGWLGEEFPTLKIQRFSVLKPVERFCRVRIKVTSEAGICRVVGRCNATDKILFRGRISVQR